MGLQDGFRRHIDGALLGRPGGNAVAILSRGRATVEAVASGTTSGRDVGIMVVIDSLFEQDALADLRAVDRLRCR